MAMDYQSFKNKILEHTGICLDSYKEDQMKRRLESLISRKSYGGYDGYIEKICSDKKVYEEFLSYMTINVSEFYRNPEQWKILEDEVIPTLMNYHGEGIKIWSAACSTGDEPYSLVMLLSKFMSLDKITILATDIDNQIIEKAKTGIYTEASLKRLPKEFLDKYFTEIGPCTYKISDEIKSRVTFKQHDLIKDRYPTDVDLIVCRNVLIYFTDDAKNEIYKKFYNAMSEKSVLFIGSTEQVMRYREIGFDIFRSFFYKKGI